MPFTKNTGNDGMDYINLIKAAFSSIVRSGRAFNRPVHLQIEPTTNCNLKCQFCSREKIISEPKQLKFETFKRVFDQMMPSKVSISGRGEPLLADDLCRMIAYARGKGSRTTITTNFTLGAVRAKELIESGIDNIRISFESSTPEAYKRIRGSDLHRDVLLGIEKVNEIKKQKCLSRPDVGFELVLTKNSVGEVLRIIAMAERYKVKRLNLRTLSTFGIEDKKHSLLLEMNKDVLSCFLNDVRVAACSAGVLTNVDELIDEIDFVHEVSIGGKNIKPECLHPWLQAYVNVDGAISPCDALNTCENISFGNIFKDGFADTWNSKKYIEARQTIRQRGLPFKSCQYCPSKGLGWFVEKFKFLRL